VVLAGYLADRETARGGVAVTWQGLLARPWCAGLGR